MTAIMYWQGQRWGAVAGQCADDAGTAVPLRHQGPPWGNSSAQTANACDTRDVVDPALQMELPRMTEQMPGRYPLPPSVRYLPRSSSSRAGPATGTNRRAIGSLICPLVGAVVGGLGIVGGWWPRSVLVEVGLVVTGGGFIAGIVLGVIALTQIKRTGQRGLGFAVTGFAMGVLIPVGIFIYLLIIALGVAFQVIDAMPQT